MRQGFKVDEMDKKEIK